MKEEILKTLDVVKSDLLRFTEKLIEIPTENPPGVNYRECIHLIERELNIFNLETKIIEIDTPESLSFPRYALLSFFGEDEETIYFHGHYDVVPSSDKAQFLPIIKEGKLFGRGASDMKGGLASMIYAVRILQLCNFRFNGKVCIIIVPDEETGGKHGTEYLFDKNFIKNGIAMFTPEPSELCIWNACRGAISLIIEVKGKQVHVTLKNQGKNAFLDMVKVVNELIKLKTKVEKRETRFKILPPEASKSILMIGGYCRGGTNFNIVPGECSFSIERRINPEEDLNKEKEALFKLLNKLKKRGIRMNMRVFQEGNSAYIPGSHPIVNKLSSTVKDITNNPPDILLCPGLLETRFYIKNGIPALAYGPGLLSVSHGPEEFVNIEDLYKCAAIYALTAARLLSEG